MSIKIWNECFFLVFFFLLKDDDDDVDNNENFVMNYACIVLYCILYI